MPRWFPFFVVLNLLLVCPAAVGFNGHKVTEGPLTITIGEVGPVTEYEVPQMVSVELANSGGVPLAVQLEMKGLVDEWRSVGPTEAGLTIGAGQTASASFQIAAGARCHSAHYPVHVYATFEQQGGPVTAHAVRVFETRFEPAGESAAGETELPVTKVPSAGAVPLATSATHRVTWNYYDGPAVALPVGWQGSDSTSRASFSRTRMTRGQTRQAIHMHPPYVPGGGSIFAEYRLRLPDVQPIRLVFFNAIRDHGPTEPPSDGVTFRVWADGEKLFEQHTDAKTWKPGEADLSRLAGREILLRLESHPGPNRSTTCDSSYWGDPVVVAGEPPKMLSEAKKRQLMEQARQAVRTGNEDGENVFVFRLDSGCRAALALGPNGLADGAVAFGSGDRAVAFEGLEVSILDQPVGRWPSAVFTEAVEASRDAAGRLRVVHRLRMEDEPFELTIQAWKEQAGLRVQVACPEGSSSAQSSGRTDTPAARPARRITDVALGPADQQAPRVYYGHGYCIVEPEAFRAHGGGHNLSTSHVGFDFERGVSLLTACDVPPDNLEVDPERNIYALHTHPDATLTFVPGLTGALDCALAYRPLYDKRPSAGVARKAGRFVFDIWGGRYADDTALLRRAFAYGLTDALVIMHVWQRWGYDYRLPDIYPPNPDLGTLEDMQELSRTCAEHGVLFGLHDNYIDFYPDAEDFSYEHITFTESGSPRKAWINLGRDAQSYQWRPDHIQPFVERNLRLIAPSLDPTAYFIDVFTSANSFDYFDRQGNFHSKLETRRSWGEAFAWIRDMLGNNAPMCSEAGGDHLIGYVDGSDCQFLQIGPESKRFHIRIPCRDWERVPWFDAVNHTRFSLHGVGYSGRYQGGRPRPLHGIASDDYISAEILTGHALMVDRNEMVRGAVRKYRLAQDLIRSLATDEIVRVEYAGGDLHRQIVTWKSGGKVYVNRGQADWQVAGRTLPQYGYFAASGPIESSIERIGGAIAEQSRSAGGFYVNGRGYDPDPPLRIRPEAERVEYLGDRRFKLIVNWNAQAPAPKDLAVFMHFFQPQVSRLKLDGFYGGGGMPSPPTSQWHGTVTTGDNWTMTLPEDLEPGEFEILVGLYDSRGDSRRYRLLGDEDPERRYRIGMLVVEEADGRVADVRLEKPAGPPPLISRLEPNRGPVDFGVAKTLGAFSCRVEKNRLVVTPLPDGDPFSLSLRMNEIVGRPVRVQSVEAVDPSGAVMRKVDFESSDHEISFTTAEDDFAYEVKLDPVR